MNWTEAMAVARAGRPVRRAVWVDRWISYSENLWWLTQVDPITLMQSPPRVVQATDWSPFEFRANDWTTDAIPATGKDEVLLDYRVVTVPATANPFYAYTSPSYVVFVPFVMTETVGTCLPVFVPRPGAARSVDVSASGRWSDYSFVGGLPVFFGPNGIQGSATVPSEYLNFTPPIPGTAGLTSITPLTGTLVGLWANSSQIATEMLIGNHASFVVPDDAIGIWLGMHKSISYSVNLGSLLVELLWSSQPLA